MAWEATDLRLIQRMVEDRPVEIYAFTLILKEPQGRGINFTILKYTITSPEAEVLTEKKTVRLELLPNGELRIPFSYGIKFSEELGRSFRPTSPAWSIILTGKDDQDRPVRVVIKINLPSKPLLKELRRLKNENS